MRAILARGSHREIGRALGEEGGKAFRESVLESERYLGLRPWLGSDRMAAIMAASRDACPAFIEEIEGIGEGAGVPLEQILLWNCRGDLPSPSRGSEGCTSIMLPPTASRAATIAHNEDGGANLAGQGFIARVEPDRGPGFTAFCYPGMLPGHAFAMNDAGLVQAINNISPHDLSAGIARHVVCRAVLASSRLDEALGWLRRTDRAAGFHHNLASARESRLVSVEAPASGCVAKPVAGPMAHANHLVFAEFSSLAQTVPPSTAARQDRAQALLAEARDPLDILFDRANERLPILCRGEVESGRSYTLATALFRIEPSGIALDVFDGPERSPVYSSAIELGAAIGADASRA
jgi:hypothetical protein